MTETFYCPRCAANANDNVAFCRNCGLPLAEVKGIVTGNAANSPETTTRPNFNMIRVGLALFILGTVIGLVNVIVRDLGLFPEIYGKAICLIFVSAGLLSIGTSFLFPVKVYKKRNRKDTDADFAMSLDTGPLDSQLPPAAINDTDISFPKDSREQSAAEPTSVTENTTRQLG